MTWLANDRCPTCAGPLTGFTTLFCPRCAAKPTVPPPTKAWYVCFTHRQSHAGDVPSGWVLTDPTYVRTHFSYLIVHPALAPFEKFRLSSTAGVAYATCCFGPPLTSLDQVVD